MSILTALKWFLVDQFTFSLGGGVGEAALFGAAFGGAKSLITGEDPLEGALLGGLTGGAMNAATGAILGTGAEALPAGEMVDSAGSAITPLTDTSSLYWSPSTQVAVQNAENLGIANPNALSMMENLPGAAGKGGYDMALEAGKDFKNMPADIANITQKQAWANQGLTGTESATAGLNPTAGLGSTDAGLNWYNRQGFDIRPSMGITKDSTDLLGKSLNWAAEHPGYSGAIAGAGMGALQQPKPVVPTLETYKSKLAEYDPNKFTPYTPTPPNPAYRAQYAEGGITAAPMDKVDFMGGDMYPMSQQARSFYATPSQMPTSAQQAMASYEPSINPLTGQPVAQMAEGGIAGYNLGGYASGGNPRLLKGPGDGMSDNIPATIGRKQPARLADGEFVVPADVVSHLGNGSTDAGAKHLYSMMDNVRKARTGSKKQGKQIKPEKFLPA